MTTTGVLGSTFATLGNLTLGGSPIYGELVERTPGLVALWKCDDPPGQISLAGLNNLQAAVLTLGAANVPYTQADGIDDYAIATPIAPQTDTHVYDTSRHLKFATNGANINVGDAGTIELWFKPLEFADEIAPPPAPSGSDANRDYEILRVDSGATRARIRFLAGWPSQFGAFGQLLRVNFTTSDFPGPEYSGVWDGFANAGSDGTGFLSYSGPVPPCEVGHWYYLAFTWDQTGYAKYLNGVHVPNDNTGTATPAANFNGCDVSFGQCGGLYDLVAITNRRMSDAEIKYRYDPGAAGAPATSNINLTTFLLTYAAGYQSNARVTNQTVEVLRTGHRNARVTSERIEVLRATEATPYITPYVTDRLSFTETATGDVAATGTVYRRSLTDTLTYTQTASATVHTPIVRSASVSQTLTFTENAHRVRMGSATSTLTFTQTTTAAVSHTARDTFALTQTVTTQFIRGRDVLQNLVIAQSEAMGATHNVLVTDDLAVTETWQFGHLKTGDTLQALDFVETVDTALYHTYEADLADTLVLSEAAELRYGKDAGAAQSLLFVDTVQLRRIIVRGVTDTLAFAEAVPPQARVIVRGVTDHLLFAEGDIPTALPVTINGVTVIIAVPVAQLVKVTKSVILQSRTGSVVLPVPEFGDTDSSGDLVSVKRSMNGVFYSYVQTSPTRLLKYTFFLGRRKALELRRFVQSSQSTVITLTNWKGERYTGQMAENAIQFNTTGRYARGGEKVSVDFNFEGVRL